MKKIVLTLSLLIASLSFVNASNFSQNEDDSYACRVEAYNYTNSTGYEYGSADWQWAYVSTKRLCELGELE